MAPHLTKVGYNLLFILQIIIACQIANAQDFSIKSIKFPNIGYVEYHHSYKSFYSKDSITRDFKLWFLASSEKRAIKQFVLLDSLETIVYNHGILTHYLHESKKKHITVMDEKEAFNNYQHKLSNPHILPYYLYSENIERGKIFTSKIGRIIKINIDVDIKYDSVKHRKFRVKSEFEDSNLINYSYEYFKPEGGSNYLALSYKAPVLDISKSLIDSICENYLEAYNFYENRESSNELKETRFATKFSLVNTIINTEDSVINLVDSNTKLIILDFWYIGCRPCKNAIPFLKEIHKKYSTKGVVLIGVNPFDNEIESINNFILRNEIKYAIALNDTNPYFENFSIKIFPTMLILDKKGKLLYSQEGYSSGNDGKVEQIILRLLK